MDAGARLSKAASLIGDPSRAAMLWSLLGGESRPASELAMLANVSPQTASNHLRLLVDAGFLKAASAGRNRFYRLASPPVAAAIESLAGAVLGPSTDSPGAAQRTAPELVFARTCYDHLAGELSVAILRSLSTQNYLRPHVKDFHLTPAGDHFLRTLGVDVPAARSSRRRFAYACLDWSHRVPHLGGALGAALLDWLLHTKMLARTRTGRAVRLTDSGRERLAKLFAIRIARDGRSVVTALERRNAPA
jgi:DNA-binding transcriptional ArsR family regulator